MPKKRKDGLYEKAKVINGRTVHFYAKTLRELDRKIYEYQTQPDKNSKFEKIADDWLAMIETKVEYNTYKGYVAPQKRAVDWFKDEYITNITAKDINRKLEAFSRKASNKTVTTQKQILRQIFQYAVQLGFIEHNIVRELPTPEGTGKKIVEPASNEDVKKIIEHASDDTFSLFPFIAIYTGLRRSELLALTWEDIDLKNRRISVDKALYYENCKPKVKKPKTAESIGFVPIVNELYNVLEPIAKKKGVIFEHDGGYMNEANFAAALKRYHKATGTTFNAHQLRHYYTDLLIQNGVPAERARYLLRHRQISTTLDIYASYNERLQKIVFDDVMEIKA